MASVLQRLRECALANPQRIVIFEGEEYRTLIAAESIARARLAHLTLLGNPQRIQERMDYLGLRLEGIRCIDPECSPQLESYAAVLCERRKVRMSEAEAVEMAKSPPYFAGLMVAAGDADAFVGGAATTTAETTRAVLATIGKHPEAALVSSFHLMISPQRGWGVKGAFLFADCGVIPDPSASQLAEIALATADNARAILREEPRVAMLSFSTLGSAEHRQLESVIKATQIVKARAPRLAVEGETQLDSALVPEIAARKAPGSGFAGGANVLIFPDLNSGNIGYKIAERLGGCAAVGPVYQGLAGAASDLSRGCEPPDIADAVVLVSFQAARMKVGAPSGAWAAERSFRSTAGNGHASRFGS
ncbi:MAG: phosphate acyltransferase [Terriglobia bacterium]